MTFISFSFNQPKKTGNQQFNIYSQKLNCHFFVFDLFSWQYKLLNQINFTFKLRLKSLQSFESGDNAGGNCRQQHNGN